MRIIAHRGLVSGPNFQDENQLEKIEYTIDKLGFDAEIDLWYDNYQLWLGHDAPTSFVPMSWLVKHHEKLWIHCKNIDCMVLLSQYGVFKEAPFNYFWHQKDDVTLTSQKYIWTYPGKQLRYNSIAVLPESFLPTFEEVRNLNCFGICTDYAIEFSKILDTDPKMRYTKS